MRAFSFLLACGACFAQSGLPDLTPEAMERLRARAAKVAAIRTPEQVRERQQYVRERILAQIGGLPEKTPLRPQITGTLQREGYRIEKLIFESQPNYFVTANLYLPERGAPPFPAVVGVAGHSAAGKAAAFYQTVWISLARRGFVVLAFDPMGQGERSEYFDIDLGRSKLGGGGTREHTMAGVQCLLTGTTFARHEIWDGIRAVDYLVERKDVDAKRIAVAGNSGGGTQSAYLAVMDPRLAAAVSSCYMTSWQQLWTKPGPQDAEQVFPGFLRDGLDFGDFFLSFAPKPFTMLTAIRDFFPIDGARATHKEVVRVYEAMGASEKAGYFEYDDNHGWTKPRRQATYRWLEKWLQGRTTDGAEGEVTTEHESQLFATPSGQVATWVGGETVQSLNQQMAERIYPQRKAAGIKDAGELRRIVAGVMGAATPSGSAGQGKPAILFIGRRDADAEALERAGHTVIVYDAAAGGTASGGYTGEYQAAQRAILLGKTLIGMHLTEIQKRVDELAASGPVALYGKGNGGVLALYAAALDPRIQKVAVEASVMSYMDIVRAKIHNAIEIAIPGVLRSFDLPDLARAIAPRPLWIVSPVAPSGTTASASAAKEQYPGATVKLRPEGWTFEQVYAGW
jgi:cephalosporin-C deacetylase-like acetyl esterase